MKNILLLLLLFGSTTAVLHAQTTCANRCLNFDGKDDYVQLAKSPVQGNVNFTIEGWFRSLDNDGLTNCPNGNFERIIGCGGSRLEIGECAGNFAVFIAGSYLPSGVTSGDGLWHHFAVVKDGAAFRVYLDGNIVITHNLPASPAFALDNVFRIGRWAGGGGLTESWQGDVDEIRVWDTALPESALWSNLDCKLTGKESGLLVYCNFDQGTPGGSNTATKTLTDLSASKNNGALNTFALAGTGSNWICSGTPQAVFCGDPTMAAPGLIAPVGNAIIQTSPKRTVRFEWSSPYSEGQDVQYKIEIFKGKTAGDSAVQVLNLVRVFADSFANRLNTEVLVEKLQPELKKLERYYWKVTAKYGAAGSTCVNGCASQQSVFSLLASDYDVNVKVTGFAKCATPAYDANGNVVYNVSVTVQNLSLGTSGAGVALNFWKPRPPNTTSGLSSRMNLYHNGNPVFSTITNFASIPAVLPNTLSYLGSATLTFTIALPAGTTVPLMFEAYFNTVDNDLAGNPLVPAYTTPAYSISLEPCICKQHECLWRIHNPLPPLPLYQLTQLSAALPYDKLEINQAITVTFPTPVTRVMAEIIYFDHYQVQDVCCKVMCNTAPSKHAEFIGTGTLLSASPFTGWQNSGQPMDFIDNFPGPPDFESAGVSWYSTTAAGTTMTNVPLHLEIAIPKLSPNQQGQLKCDCFNLCIRYTIFDKDCKVCERVISYRTCQPLFPPPPLPAFICR